MHNYIILFYVRILLCLQRIWMTPTKLTIYIYNTLLNSIYFKLLVRGICKEAINYVVNVILQSSVLF